MGYQPGLDGIRAVSVLIVILYHAGFGWMHGGFFGVEVFFVVSGFLITSLLLDERESTGETALGQFWLRRARRLLPALFTMLIAVSVWASFGGEKHLDQLGKDMPWAILYVSNWGQIVGKVPYFAPTDPPLLRHLWSLAVEEQWYLIWPLIFVGLVGASRGRTSRLAIGLLAASLASMVFSVVLTLSDAPTVWFFGSDPARYNFLYLNTVSRASGLLLGAAFAFFWRPWRWARAAQLERTGLDVAGIGAVVAVVLIAMTRAEEILQNASLYRIWLPLVTVLSMVAVAMVVHPGARRTRALFGWTPLVEVGKRSYGLYLWHWPIFVLSGVRDDHVKLLWVAPLTVAVAEACYRWIETPVRKGALGRRWAELGGGPGVARRATFAGFTAASLFLVMAIGVRLRAADPVDVAKDDTVVEFELPGDVDPVRTVAPTEPTSAGTPATSDTAGSATTPVADSTTTTTLPSLPRSVVIVGDSQAHSLAINLPDGIESTFTISDGSVEGCGVLTDGNVRSSRSSFNRSLSDCAGFAEKWGQAAGSSAAQVALVVIGAWDVFDVEVDGTLIPFGSAEADQRFLTGLRSGIDALLAAGSHVALLEIACMRPQDVEGAGVPALPERGDDARVAHVNDLMRQAANDDPTGRITFVSGPPQWCTDETISADLGYRWDGVHVYKPGANLIYTAIAPALLAIPL